MEVETVLSAWPCRTCLLEANTFEIVAYCVVLLMPGNAVNKKRGTSNEEGAKIGEVWSRLNVSEKVGRGEGVHGSEFG